MGLDYKRKIPDVDELLKELPLSEELKIVKEKRDKDIADIFTGKSNKFLLIIGPCSADNEDAVLKYIEKLARVQEKMKNEILIIPRVYTNKPRTMGTGYKGIAHQPDPTGKPNIVEGIKAMRRMHIRLLKESHLTAADEMLYPGNYPFLEDLLSYVAIGARSVENQQHRLTVSGLDIPIGMKNSTSGDLTIMMNSITAAQRSHVFIYNGWEVESKGNPLSHAILRGAVNTYGRTIPNYHYEDMMRLVEMYKESKLHNPALIVDTNHANSDKHYEEQPRIAMEVLNSIKKSKDLKKMVKGLMIESYLEEGRQDIGGTCFGKSITDPCLGWNDSEQLIYDIAENL